MHDHTFALGGRRIWATSCFGAWCPPRRLGFVYRHCIGPFLLAAAVAYVLFAGVVGVPRDMKPKVRIVLGCSVAAVKLFGGGLLHAVTFGFLQHGQGPIAQAGGAAAVEEVRNAGSPLLHQHVAAARHWCCFWIWRISLLILGMGLLWFALVCSMLAVENVEIYGGSIVQYVIMCEIIGHLGGSILRRSRFSNRMVGLVEYFGEALCWELRKLRRACRRGFPSWHRWGRLRLALGRVRQAGAAQGDCAAEPPPTVPPEMRVAEVVAAAAAAEEGGAGQAGQVSDGLRVVWCRDVRYTQARCSDVFSDGRSIDSLISALVRDPSLPLTCDPLIIDAVQHDGQLYSIDNRRLLGFHKADDVLSASSGGVRVMIRIRHHHWGRLFDRFMQHFDTANQGMSIVVRSSRNTTH